LEAEVEVNSIGFSTVEMVPLFHYKPGSVVQRLLAYPSRWLERPCSLPYAPCEWLSAPRSYPSYLVRLSVVASLRARWPAEATVLDGVETWRFAGDLQGLKPLVARTQLVEPPGREGLDGLDALVVDVAAGSDAGIVSRVVREALRLGVWVEVNLYMEEPEYRAAAPYAEALRGTEAPLHVHLTEHKGGGAVRRLYLRLRGVHWPVYIHVDTYWELDTTCPRCGAYIATRHPYYLVSLAVKPPSNCHSCGAPIPLRGPLRRKTDELIRRTMGASIYWVDPQLLGGKPLKS
jgi:hypothetical protein